MGLIQVSVDEQAAELAEGVSRVARGPLRIVLLLAGWLLVGLAALGVVLPVLPTTPFLLVAGACFARSSERADRWLRENRVFGPYVRSWRQSRALPQGARPRAVAVVLLTFGLTIGFGVSALGLRLLLAAICAALVTFLLRLPVVEDAVVEDAVVEDPPA